MLAYDSSEQSVVFHDDPMARVHSVGLPVGTPPAGFALRPERLSNGPTPDIGVDPRTWSLREPAKYEPMPAQLKPTFPPIFSPGLKEIRREDIGKIFLDPTFDSPLRRRLTAQLRSFIAELERLDVHGDLWINGSYATKKPEPGDIDLVMSIPLIIVSAMSEEKLDRLNFMTDPENRAYVRARWQVDFYVFERSNIGSRNYYFDLFSRNPDSSNQKGIPFVKL